MSSSGAAHVQVRRRTVTGLLAGDDVPPRIADAQERRKSEQEGPRRAGAGTPAIVSDCKTLRSDPCREPYETWLACLAAQEVCDAQGKVDKNATYSACSDEQNAAKACASNPPPDGGPSSTEGGTTNPGKVEIVSASLSGNESTAYLIQFHLKNGTMHAVQAMPFQRSMARSVLRQRLAIRGLSAQAKFQASLKSHSSPRRHS